MAARVLIRGEGVAAACCARLLSAARFPFTFERSTRPKLPALMVGTAAQALFKDVFGNNALFEGLPRIERRVVAWGPAAEPVELPHFGVVVSEQALLDRLHSGLHPGYVGESEYEWSILASRPLPAPSVDRDFGSRAATAVPAKLKQTGRAACWIESLEDGWLFLLPSGPENGWLLSVGARPESLLARSRVVGPQIQDTDASVANFPAYPRIAWPLCAPGWFACGTAALGFDPLCGDGAGNAVREAILAVAAVRAIASGADMEPVLAHYRARLLWGFQRHLESCLNYYDSGSSGSWWGAERSSLHEGLQWCAQQLHRHPKFRYQLHGFELVPLK